MKKIVSIVSVVVLVSIVLSSCTSQKNGLAIKRKYNKGYYIAHNHKKNNIESRETVETSQKRETITKSEEVVVASPSFNSVTEKVTPVVVEVKNDKEIKKTNIAEVRHNSVLVDSKEVTVSTAKIPVKTKHDVVNVEKTATAGAVDTSLILLIVFCFFPILSLIAMYLHDGKSITLNFWVNLILYLTFIGWIIFGLLVVLDIINLA
ncbi:MAG: hypothetical protein JNM51_12115 [Bacteroidia bacterium]|nr:hypothetical protein [Bacteroidia bacterium]